MPSPRCGPAPGLPGHGDRFSGPVGFHAAPAGCTGAGCTGTTGAGCHGGCCAGHLKPEVLVDRQGTLDLAQARASNAWQTLASLDAAGRLAGKAVWLRWALPAPAAGHGAEVARLAPAATDRLDVWLLAGNRVVAEHHRRCPLPSANCPTPRWPSPASSGRQTKRPGP
ncbi:MAG: 7TM-DISM domain-containing protein [Burkholderiaceae bacterium]